MTGSRSRELSPEWPFPGLRPFSFPDSDFFFGRDEQKYALYRMLVRNRFVAVIGGSGSGKSSLVFAALHPLLDKENEEYRSKGSEEGAWVWVETRPGWTPLDNLTHALAKLSLDTDEEIARARRERIAYCLRLSRHGISEALSEMDSLGHARMVIVVDQFEELFRFSMSREVNGKDPQKQAQALNEAETFVQLLIQATRTSEAKVHVLITMRSDFIGDCARFQGLPELVSAAQFLVPAVTRSQCEEIIRKPLAKSGSSIEPELVTCLLNDSGGQLDQLPVLQHCLLRLWEKATPVSTVEDAGGSSAGDSKPEKAVQRRLTVAQYNGIGGMSGALAQHANEIMAQLPERAVEKTFRALAEIDRDGRAIRRSLLFGQLNGEVVGQPDAHTEINDADLRSVLKRFCSDDCSFLVSSSDVEKDLRDDTAIDVSHEALLRRWDRVSGNPGATNPASKGWLRIETDDGQRYRHLLFTDTLHSKEFKKEWDWWTKLRPTAAWAERYGGGYDRVQAMFGKSRLRRRIVIGSLAALALIAIVIPALGMLTYQKVQQKAASDNYDLAIGAAKGIMDEVIKGLDGGKLTLANASSLLGVSDDIVAKVKRVSETPQTKEAHAEFLAERSDIYVNLGKMPDALKDAQSAKELADSLVASDPSNGDWQLLLYRALFRVGDVQDILRNQIDAKRSYQKALDVVEVLFKKTPDNLDEDDMIAFIYNKLGDMALEQPDYGAAKTDYESAVSIMERLVKEVPSNLAYARDLASSYFNQAQLLVTQGKSEDALSLHEKVLELRRKELANEPNNPVFLSHVAVSLVAIGKLQMQLSRPDEAVEQFREAVKDRQTASVVDITNRVYQSSLATALDFLGDALQKTGSAEAVENYNKALSIRQGLVAADPDNEQWHKALETLQNKITKLGAPN